MAGSAVMDHNDGMRRPGGMRSLAVALLCAAVLAGVVSMHRSTAAVPINPVHRPQLAASVFVPHRLFTTGEALATTTKFAQDYIFEARYDTDTGALRVRQRLELVNEAGRPVRGVNLSVIPRALDGFALYDVRVDGDPADRSWTTRTNLRVRFGRDVAPGEAVIVRLRFKVQPKLQTGAFSARLARQAGVSSFGEWFPIVSQEHDSYGVGDPQVSYRADRIELRLTTSSSLRRDAVACPGRQSAPDTRGKNWTCRVRNVRDFAFVVNPDFQYRSRRVGDTRIRVFTETVSGAVTLDKAASALRRLNDLLGTYPYDDLVLAEVGGSSGFSMEYPRQIHLTRSKVNDSYVINHEVAHQWFYGLLGNNQMRAPWLDEGFSDFLARYLMGVGANQCSSKNIDVEVFAFPAGLTSGGNWTECQGYFFTVFNKSTAMLNQVRAAMGTSDFFAALRAHLSDRRFGMTTSRAMLEHLEAWDGANLRPIFEAYTKRY
jgi:hypothetical protein